MTDRCSVDSENLVEYVYMPFVAIYNREVLLPISAIIRISSIIASIVWITPISSPSVSITPLTFKIALSRTHQDEKQCKQKEHDCESQFHLRSLLISWF